MIADPAPPRRQLLRILGVTFTIAMGLGNMIGSGILRAPSAVAASAGSAGLVLALWCAGALQATLEANVFVEMGTALPLAGGPYVFARRALGDGPGLIVGWAIWGSKIASLGAAAVSFAEFLALVVPAAAPNRPGIALGVLAGLFGLNILGLREGRALQETTSFAKAALLLLFIIAAFFLAPLAPTPASPAHAAGWAGIAIAYKLIRGAYTGWDGPLYFSEESRAPATDLPRGLFIGLLSTSALYIGVTLALLHALGAAGVAATPLPFMTVLDAAIGRGASIVFALGAMVTVLSVANANVMSAPRILFALSRDRLLPAALSEVNAGGSPHLALIATGAASILLAATGKFVLLFGLIGTLDALAVLLTIVSHFVLRRRAPDLARPWRAWGHPVLPALALALDLALLVVFNASDREGFLAAAAITAICLPFAWIARRNALDKGSRNGTP